MARRQIELSNRVAAELAGAQDTMLRALEERVGCELYLLLQRLRPGRTSTASTR